MKKSTNGNVLKVVGSGLLASALIACGAHSNQSSATKVTNGREITESTYPSVALLVMQLPEGQALCTGTFVNDSQVITAGHCVEGLSDSAPEMYFVTKKVVDGQDQYQALAKAVSYKRNPNYSIALGVSPYDMSVVNFPANTAPATSVLARTAPRSGETLTIVGYGNSAESVDANGLMSGDGAGTKRIGTNRVESVSGGFINFSGLAAANGSPLGTQVSSGSGDSGGPLFVSGKLAGITSGGGLIAAGNGTFQSTSKYVDVNSSVSRAFLATTLKTAAR